MSELTYDDFKSRVNIQDLLVDAGAVSMAYFFQGLAQA